MNPTTDDLCRRGEQLGAMLAPAELADVPMYVVPQSRLPFDLGGDSVCHGFTTGSLDLHLQDVIGRDWRGRGACVVVNDVALHSEFADSYDSKFLGTVVHELAHVLERPSPYRPRPDIDADTLRREATEVAKVVSGPPTNDEELLPWFGHEARFIRIAMHLWYRAKQFDLYLFPDEIMVADWYALSPANWYAQATQAEAERMANATFREICSQKLPEPFRGLWTGDVLAWSEATLRKEPE